MIWATVYSAVESGEWEGTLADFDNFLIQNVMATSIIEYLSTMIHLSLYPSIHLSIYPSIQLSIYPSIHLSISPSIHLSINPIIHPSNYPSIQKSTYPSIHLSISWYLYLMVPQNTVHIHGISISICWRHLVTSKESSSPIFYLICAQIVQSYHLI